VIYFTGIFGQSIAWGSAALAALARLAAKKSAMALRIGVGMVELLLRLVSLRVFWCIGTDPN